MQNLRLPLGLLFILFLSACTLFIEPKTPVETEARISTESGDDVALPSTSEQEIEIPPQVEVPQETQETEVPVTVEISGETEIPLVPVDPEIVEVEQDTEAVQVDSPAIEPNPVIRLCEEVGGKLGSVSVKDCLDQQLIHSGYTTAKRSLAFKDYPPLAKREPLGRVLVIGGIHGDEFSSVSVIIKWMKILDQHHSGLFHWRFVPTANPDGLLNHKSQRQNQNGVDLNRNFPTADWEEHALVHWEENTYRNPRRHPGASQASEPETQWLVKQIEEFVPDVIISLHAPYHLVDYDGPPTAPDMLGALYLRRLGVYPGSLGNYAGIDLQMPIVTVELQSAGILPVNKEIDNMWTDLVRWLSQQLSK